MNKFQVHLGDSEPSPPRSLLLSRPGLDNILLYMESTGTSHLSAKLKVEVSYDIVCTTEVLELIMRTPYEMMVNWTLAVTKYRNTIYISPVVPEDLKTSPMKELNADWLAKLRRHFLSENANAMLKPCDPMEPTGQYNGVFSFSINGTRFIFDSPVLAEGFRIGSVRNSNYVFTELQFRPDSMSVDEWATHNRCDALKWWSKCFLVGIENIYIANVNRHIIAHTINKISVRQLWKDCEKVWSPQVCVNFLVRLVDQIRSFMSVVDCPKTVYLMKFDASQGEISYTSYLGRNPFTFIPDWFPIMLDERMEDLTPTTLHKN
ncbi:GL25389 [Drosophila persimilis]|uniref:Decapping nuclease n=1 Tax=Drosophila persimilis TaxID=7234 RepID=B4GU56_DROPE|nr:protein cutoff [Drosophila persimilis]XP_026845696.1 protein cutoff-like [Drosophila persimilis]EDW26139.1 GL25389 [Drosophila persimilis]